MHVYKRVRQYLDDNHLKQISVAKKAGIPVSTFNAMLNGKRKMYADDLRAICYALGVGADTFIKIKDEGRRHEDRTT